MSILEIDRLTVRYPESREPVLREISLTIGKGEKVLIMGPSGGGKSTLALALNGVIPQSVEAETSGEVRVMGRSVREAGVRRTCRDVGILFQDPESQFCMLTVEDEILFGLENLRLPREEMTKRLEKSLRLTGLEPWRTSRLHELSGGMKQKLGLACLLAMDQPRVHPG